MLTVARPTHCIPYVHCYQCLPVTRLTGTGHHQRPSYICLSVAMLTVTRHHQCPMPPCYKAHCCKASSVPYASLLQGPLLQGLISALSLPVARLTAASSPPSLLSLRALCYYSLYTALCWSVFYTHDGLVWSVFYTPTVRSVKSTVRKSGHHGCTQYCRFHFSSNIRGPFPGNV